MSTPIAASTEWVSIDPSFLAVPAFRNEFVRTAHKIEGVLKNSDPSARLTALQKLRLDVLSALRAVATIQDNLEVQLSTSILFDLVEQGWTPKVVGAKVSLKRPVYHEDALLAKEQIRRTLTLEREEQLAQPAVREFVQNMEVRRLGPKGGWVSIFSLMRDGEELAAKLKVIAAQPDLSHRTEALRDVVKPYLQFVTEDSICEHTGFRLMDIWRYFRLTWATAYKSTPGRRMMILVRDAGAPCHPVMGIAGLSSAVMQLTRRDEWIGWYGHTFIANLSSNPTAKSARWLLNTLDACFSDILLTDLIRDKVVTRAELKKPTRTTIGRLLDASEKAIKHHRLYPKTSDIKAMQQASDMTGVQWKMLAAAPLFRAKRARALSALLKIRIAFREAGFTHPTKDALSLAITRGPVKTAIASLLRIVKAENVGTDIMDISVCGAVAPYNSILGGKLVSMLMASPGVVREVKRRYSKTPSVIASAMKGKPVIRKPHLVLLGTTSLYHVGSSQYNRIRIEASLVGGVPGKNVEFIPLGETVGYGSFHFRTETLALIESYVARSMQNRRVNSIFGEGVSPRLRKIRQGLGAIGLSGDLLRHGTPRLVYMLPLAENFREVLLGLSSTPKYFLPPGNPEKTTEFIAEYWRRRWLAGRIEREGVLEAVACHALSYPVRHGAKITLPADVLSADAVDQ